MNSVSTGWEHVMLQWCWSILSVHDMARLQQHQKHNNATAAAAHVMASRPPRVSFYQKQQIHTPPFWFYKTPLIDFLHFKQTSAISICLA